MVGSFLEEIGEKLIGKTYVNDVNGRFSIQRQRRGENVDLKKLH